MICKGDIVRLFNPSEMGLMKKSHMHIVIDKIDAYKNYKRKFVVCTTNPIRYIKEGYEFIGLNDKPFREYTYIRLDPIYVVKNVRIDLQSRTIPHKLCRKKEDHLMDKINNSSLCKLNRDKFIKLNYKYAIPISI